MTSNANANQTPTANPLSNAARLGGYSADDPQNEALAEARAAIPAMADFEAATAAIRKSREAFNAQVAALRAACEKQVAELRAAYDPENGRMLEALDVTPLDALGAALALREYGEGEGREQERLDYAEGFIRRYFWQALGLSR